MPNQRGPTNGWVTSLVPLLTLALTTLVPIPSTAADKKPAYADSVHQRVDQALDKLQSDNDADAAITSLRALFTETTLYSPEDHPDALRHADFGLRLASQLKTLPPEQRPALLKYLRANDNLAQTLAFFLRPDDDAAGAYSLLDRLRAQRGELLDKYATLTAAICAVHHAPFERHVNENKAKSPDALAIFDYYAHNEQRMFFGIRNVPPGLLVYVVDTTAGFDEKAWALSKYAGDRNVGRHFFDVPYDWDAFRKGAAKKVTTLGFTLPNILQYGGVCADQAYFATEVGKAIGVPTAYDSGAAGDLSHAWVGFLQTDGRNGWWNFETGRYKEYQGVRGSVMDPVSRKRIPDSYVSLLGELIGTKAVDRYNAVALTDAAAQLVQWQKDNNTPDVAAPSSDLTGVRPSPRTADTTTELALIESALHQSAGYAPAWFTVRDLAVADQLSVADKSHWADLLLRLGAKRYPDFTLAILAPMVSTIPDANEQDRLWANVIFPIFQNRFDLAASVRMHEAEMWESHNQPDKAGLCYLDVVERYANAGPFIIDALKGAEKLLNETKRGDKVVTLYAQTWAKTKKPTESAAQFMTQSNWYRVGKLYAKKLHAAGDEPKARFVEAELEKQTTPTASP